MFKIEMMKKKYIAPNTTLVRLADALLVNTASLVSEQVLGKGHNPFFSDWDEWDEEEDAQASLPQHKSLWDD